MDNVNINITENITDVAIVVTGSRGPAGAQGPEGTQGPQGIQGPEGPQGPAGADGAQGPAGPQGPQGIQGPEGPQGPAGADSTVPGPQGPQGIQGPEGPQGIQGPEGPAGPAGADGAQGPAGPNEVTASTDTNLTGILRGDGSHVFASNAGITQRTLTVTIPAGSYFDGGIVGTNKVAKTATAAHIRLTPFTLAEDITVDRIGINVSLGATAGSYVGLLGVYASGANGYPTGNPLINGSISGLDSIAFAEAVCSYTLKAGVQYWAAVMTNCNPQISAYNVWIPLGVAANNSVSYFISLDKLLTYADGLPNSIQDVVTAADRSSTLMGFAVLFRAA